MRAIAVVESFNSRVMAILMCVCVSMCLCVCVKCPCYGVLSDHLDFILIDSILLLRLPSFSFLLFTTINSQGTTSWRGFNSRLY